MAKKQSNYLVIEAQKIGFMKMIQDIERLLQSELSDVQRVALTDQRNKINEMLGAL